MGRPEKGVRFPGAPVTGSHVWSTHGGCWEWNLGPLQEQQVLLTTEAFLQLLDSLLISHLRTFELLICGWSPIKLSSLLFGLVKRRGLLHLFCCLCYCLFVSFLSFISSLNPILWHKWPLSSPCRPMSCPLLTSPWKNTLNRSGVKIIATWWLPSWCSFKEGFKRLKATLCLVDLWHLFGMLWPN